jgi:hypothetical protein
MAGAKHPRLFRKRFDDSLDDLVLVDSVVVICHVEVVTTHESDPQHDLYHAHAPRSGPAGPLAASCRSRARVDRWKLSSIKTRRHDHAGPDLRPCEHPQFGMTPLSLSAAYRTLFRSLRPRRERPFRGERCARTARTRPLKALLQPNPQSSDPRPCLDTNSARADQRAGVAPSRRRAVASDPPSATTGPSPDDRALSLVDVFGIQRKLVPVGLVGFVRRMCCLGARGGEGGVAAE